MTFPEWAALVTAYPFALALVAIWIRAATAGRDKPAPVERPTMTVEAFGKPVARWQVIEHLAPDGELLEFPVFEDRGGWTVDEVADTIAAIDALPQTPELETL